MDFIMFDCLQACVTRVYRISCVLDFSIDEFDLLLVCKSDSIWL